MFVKFTFSGPGQNVREKDVECIFFVCGKQTVALPYAVLRKVIATISFPLLFVLCIIFGRIFCFLLQWHQILPHIDHAKKCCLSRGCLRGSTCGTYSARHDFTPLNPKSRIQPTLNEVYPFILFLKSH